MNEEEFLRNWRTLKPLILAKWAKLNESDLDGVQPTVNELVKIIHARYEDSSVQSIIQDLENLDQQILKNR